MTNEEFEAVCEAAFGVMGGEYWADASREEKDGYRRQMKAALGSVAKLVGDGFYERRRAELAHPYSKPMRTEQWAELDGIESVEQWLKVEGWGGMNERVQVGYLCSRGHFQLNDDPESDTCQLKNIAPIYVEIQNPEDRDYILENIQDALASFNRKLEEWRRG